MSDIGNLLNGGKVSDVLRVGGKGLAIGAGAAATIALIRQVVEAKRQRDKNKDRYSGNIDPDTVVLRIRKKAEENREGQKPCSGTVRVESMTDTREVRPVSTVGPRELNGRFASVFGDGEKTEEKSAGFMSDVAMGSGGILAAGGGAVLGYALVSKLAQKLEQQRLKKQIAAAQTEYLDLLDGRAQKSAEAFSNLFMFGDDTVRDAEDSILKEAGVPTDLINAVKNTTHTAKGVSAGMLATWILGAGASAYVAKRLLENKFDQEEEEEPERQTRILFKAGSSEFELDPDLMLATIGILHDCIADSNPPGVKTAAGGTDYSFLDDIDKLEGGRQWLLDRYAVQNGLKRDKVQDIRLPLSMLIRHGRALSDIKKNPEKHMAGINTKVMSMMQNDPEGWFKLLGSDRNSDIVKMKANERLANLEGSGGVLGFLSKIPVLGGLVKNLAGRYMNSLGGRKMIAGQTLNQMGVTGDRAKEILSRYQFTNNGWTPSSSVKKASFLDIGSIRTSLADSKMLRDKTNKDVLKAIAELKNQRNGNKKDKPNTVVEFDDDLGSLLSDEDKARIVAGLIGKGGK